MKKKLFYLIFMLFTFFVFSISSNASQTLVVEFDYMYFNNWTPPNQFNVYTSTINGKKTEYAYSHTHYSDWSSKIESARFVGKVTENITLKNQYINVIGYITGYSFNSFATVPLSFTSNYIKFGDGLFTCNPTFSGFANNSGANSGDQSMAFNFQCYVDSYEVKKTDIFEIGLAFNGFQLTNSANFYIFINRGLMVNGNPTSYNEDITEGLKEVEETIKQENDETQEKLDETNKQLGDLNDNITNSDVSDSSDSANSFFSGFESDDFGLSSIITAPLNFIKSITSSTCNSIGFNAPFVNQRVTLPCMSSIYDQYFGNFLTIYQTITFGMIAYWVCVNTFSIVKGFKDPDSDRIEVVDL